MKGHSLGTSAQFFAQIVMRFWEEMFRSDWPGDNPNPKQRKITSLEINFFYLVEILTSYYLFSLVIMYTGWHRTEKNFAGVNVNTFNNPKRSAMKATSKYQL